MFDLVCRDLRARAATDRPLSRRYRQPQQQVIPAQPAGPKDRRAKDERPRRTVGKALTERPCCGACDRRRP